MTAASALGVDCLSVCNPQSSQLAPCAPSDGKIPILPISSQLWAHPACRRARGGCRSLLRCWAAGPSPAPSPHRNKCKDKCKKECRVTTGQWNAPAFTPRQIFMSLPGIFVCKGQAPRPQLRDKLACALCELLWIPTQVCGMTYRLCSMHNLQQFAESGPKYWNILQ